MDLSRIHNASREDKARFDLSQMYIKILTCVIVWDTYITDLKPSKMASKHLSKFTCMY